MILPKILPTWVPLISTAIAARAAYHNVWSSWRDAGLFAFLALGCVAAVLACRRHNWSVSAIFLALAILVAGKSWTVVQSYLIQAYMWWSYSDGRFGG